MDGKMSQTERISRSLRLLQKEQAFLRPEELARMQSVLYILAMKFLKPDKLKNLKEEFDMTTLGQMLMQDGYNKGINEGLKKGQSNGEARINQLIIRLADANRIDDITKAARDKKYQRKLLKEFNL